MLTPDQRLKCIEILFDALTSKKLTRMQEIFAQSMIQCVLHHRDHDDLHENFYRDCKERNPIDVIRELSFALHLDVIREFSDALYLVIAATN